MRIDPRPTLLLRLLAAAAFMLVAAVPSARAGEFYVSGDMAVAGTTGESSGQAMVAGTTATGLSTDSGDSSPLFGAALGFAFPLRHAIEWDPKATPQWLPFDIGVPRWTIRSELEWVGVSDFEIRTNSVSVPNADYTTEVQTWALLGNLLIDMPLQGATEALFGRQPWVRPFSFYAGAGVGLGSVAAEAGNNIDRGKTDDFSLAVQATAGFAYQMTQSVHLSLGYRFLDQGTVSIPLRTSAGNPAGELDIELMSHAFTTQLTWDFYWLPFPNRRASRTFFD